MYLKKPVAGAQSAARRFQGGSEWFSKRFGAQIRFIWVFGLAGMAGRSCIPQTTVFVSLVPRVQYPSNHGVDRFLSFIPRYVRQAWGGGRYGERPARIQAAVAAALPRGYARYRQHGPVGPGFH